MKKKHLREKRARKLFSALLFSSWISFMALAGFFIPSFLVQFPLFQVKRVEVNGNYRIPFEEIKRAVEELSTNLMKLKGSELESLLNAKFGNRIKEVRLEKRFTSQGIVLKVSVEERRPVARLSLGGSYRLVDKEGVIFKPIEDEGKDLVEIRTYDVDVLEEGFSKLYEQVLGIGLPLKRVLVKRDRIVLELRGKSVILPPIESLPDNLSERLRMIYNVPQEKVDLRYDRFILVRN